MTSILHFYFSRSILLRRCYNQTSCNTMSRNDATAAAFTKQGDARTTILKQIPYSTRLRHYIALYNPVLWWRATVMRKRIVRWSTYDLIMFSMLPLTGLILPQSKELISTTDRRFTLYNRSTGNWYFIFAATIKLPLYLYASYNIGRSVQDITKSILEIQQSRMIAHPDAYQCLYDRIQNSGNDEKEQCRGYRTYAYDVYLPPPQQQTPHAVGSEAVFHENPTTFLLFLPGAFVEYVAYAQPAALLSDYGYIVIVLSSESTLGIVDVHLPQFYVSHIQQIQHDMETKHGSNRDTTTGTTTTSSRNTNQYRWIFMGHSMGSLTCTKLISYFPNVKELVLWGSAPFLEYMGNLSHMEQDELRVLVVQGTKDQIIQCYCTPEMEEEYWNRLPTSTTTLHEIIGGTHHGFGNYILNNGGDDDSDTIAIGEQHAIAVQVTVEFLRRKSS